MSSAVAPHGWWASLAQRNGAARGDLAGGVTAALVLPAIEGSYGLVAFAPLGPDLVPLGFLLGALTAAVGTLVSVLAGGRGPLLSGCSAALALLYASLIGWLIADARFLGADGRPVLALLLPFLGLGLVLAGVLQLIVARLRLGGLVRYIPYPVHAGYMNGVAVLMFAAMLPHIAGVPPGVPLGWQHVKWLAPVIAAVALWFSLKPRAGTRRIPAYLTGLIVATLLHHALARTPLAGALGPLFDPPTFAWPRVDTLLPLADHVGDGLLAEKIGLLLLFAVAAALMSTLQSALAAGTIDDLTQARRDGNRELQAQGLSNVALGVIGALPSAGATARSKVNLDAGARTGASRLIFAVALLLVLIFGLRFMSLLPLAAIAGVFVALAFSLVDAWSRGATRVVLRQARHRRVHARRVPLALLQSYAVMLLVAGVTVFVSLALAVFLGVLVAMVLFIRSNVRPPVRLVARGDVRRSRKIRPAAQAALLTQHGGRIALVELDGALFFGTAEQADRAIEGLARDTDIIVLDFERVNEVDASGARVLLRAADAVGRAGKRLLLSGLTVHDARARSIQDMDVHARLAQAQIFPDADRALEFAEDELLATLAPAAMPDAPLPLADTLLGAGLDAEELALLEGLVTERRFAPGDVIFRRGNAGDALYVLLQGQVGIWLHAAGDTTPGVRGRRLVSYAPGVVFGEMGLMHGQPRSADAVAEEATVVLELARDAYDVLAHQHPAVLGRLLLSINGLLGARVRALTDELDAAQAAQ